MDAFQPNDRVTSSRVSGTKPFEGEQAAIQSSLTLEPRMIELSISNDALRDSMPIAAPATLGTWLRKWTRPWWRHVEFAYTEALCWLWARDPWQRWALSSGLGVVLGVGIVVAAAPRVRPDVWNSLAAADESVVPSSQMGMASAMLIAPLQPAPAPTAVKTAEPRVADAVPLAQAEPATAVVASEPVVGEPSATPERSPSKKGKAGGRKRSKPKSASSLSQIFKDMHRAPRERASR